MEVRKYLALLRQWYWLVLLSAFIAGVSTYLVNSNRVKLYQSSAEYLIDVAAGSGSQREYAGQLIAKGLVQDYLEIIPTSPVAQGVLDVLVDQYPEMASWTPQRLLGMISLSSPLDTQIIRISVVDDDPVRAADIANMVGEVFGEQNEVRSKSRYSEPLVKLDEQLSELDLRIAEVEIQISEFGATENSSDEVDLSRLNRLLNEAQTNYNTAFQSRLDLDIEQARSLNNFYNTEPAIPSLSAFSPRTQVNTLLSIVVGAMLAIGIVLLMDYLDDSVKTPDEVFEHTGLSTLATISFIKGDKHSDRLIAHKSPRAPVSEAFRMLRTNMSFAAIDKKMRSVLVTSSSPGEGKSTTSANLSTVLAQTGKQVVLIDADLRRPSQHKIFEISNNHGLTTALLDSVTAVTHHLQETSVPGLRLMASGPLPPNPAELLNSQRMLEVIDELLQDVDFVLVDTPPALTVADAAILAPKVDGCVLVSQVGQTQMAALMQSSTRMKSAGANMFGIVMNRSKAGSGYYQYYYDENNYYAYDHKNNNTNTRRNVLASLFGSGD